MTEINPCRISVANAKDLNPHGDFVLYWMTAFRRTKRNFALQRAAQLADELHKPLVVFEPLRINYRWASQRFHRFIIQGMKCNRDRLLENQVTYIPYVEPKQNASSGLLDQLSQRTCCVVSDDYPCFFLPSLVRKAARLIPTRFELVDSNGIIPIRLAERTFTVAHSYRRWMQKNIQEHLGEMPETNPLSQKKIPRLPKNLLSKELQKWPSADLEQLLQAGGLDTLPFDQSVPPVNEMIGGEDQGEARLEAFLNDQFSRYDTDRNHPDFKATSRLSPYLHFGHLSAHQFVDSVLRHENWSPQQLGAPNGKNSGFWNISESGEGLMDQLLTWREMGFNFAARHPRELDRYDSLPNWAKTSLKNHADDPRPYLYSLEEFEQAETHDEIWNAAQRELVKTGTLHNYMRMLWGKKILHWSRSPEEALKVMIHLNNKYALDGRDPNSYSGIFWVLGRYDRAWGPKRPVFGSVRYMTSESASKKLKMKKYLAEHSPPES